MIPICIENDFLFATLFHQIDDTDRFVQFQFAIEMFLECNLRFVFIWNYTKQTINIEKQRKSARNHQYTSIEFRWRSILIARLTPINWYRASDNRECHLIVAEGKYLFGFHIIRHVSVFVNATTLVSKQKQIFFQLFFFITKLFCVVWASHSTICNYRVPALYRDRLETNVSVK